MINLSDHYLRRNLSNPQKDTHQIDYEINCNKNIKNKIKTMSTITGRIHISKGIKIIMNIHIHVLSLMQTIRIDNWK